MLNKQMKPPDKEDTINKSILLNWLYSADKDLLILELGKWIEARTDGKYTLIKKEQEAGSVAVAENLNNKVPKSLNQQPNRENNE